MVGSKILLAGTLLLLALAPAGALAADIHTQSSTQYLWYNDPFQDKTQNLLETTLAAKGVVKADPFVYPYFTNITTQAQLRAAYNYKFVYGDPGAYVHNWWYTAQLLYDSAFDLANTVVYPGNKADFFR